MSAPQLKQAERWASASGLKLRLSTPGLKLADVLARNIAHQIVQDGWPVGRNLGSERELQERYGVGRNLLREAVRLLEAQSIAQMRRGSGGGLVVIEPSRESTIYAAALYLEFRGIDRADLQHVSRGLDMMVVDRCIERLDEAGRVRLRSALEFEEQLDRKAGPADLQRLHLVMAEITRNPALELLVDLVHRLNRFHFSSHAAHLPAVADRIRRLHREIVAAVLARNSREARNAMSRLFDYVDGWLAERKASDLVS